MLLAERQVEQKKIAIDLNTSLALKIQFDQGIEAEASLWKVCTG